jgi:hypothetical protein
MEALTSLMTQDHLVVDAMGNRVQGAQSMHAGWRGYFAMCPDYWIQIRNSFSERDTVLATGEAGGTIDDVSWRTPAAWEGVIGGGAVAESGESSRTTSRSMKSWRGVPNSPMPAW